MSQRGLEELPRLVNGNAIVIFGRGTDNRLWDVSCPSVTVCGRWQPLGGALTSGVAAVSDVRAAIPDTHTFGLGTNNQIYENFAGWAPNPFFNGWIRVTG